MMAHHAHDVSAQQLLDGTAFILQLCHFDQQLKLFLVDARADLSGGLAKRHVALKQLIEYLPLHFQPQHVGLKFFVEGFLAFFFFTGRGGLSRAGTPGNL
jgi:hypothetical protein